jgi:hypothetical protein
MAQNILKSKNIKNKKLDLTILNKKRKALDTILS